MLNLNFLRRSSSYLISLTILFVSLSVVAKAQETPSNLTSQENKPGTVTSPPASIFSIEGGDRLMQEAEQAIESQNFELAVEKLQSARQVFNQLSNFYLQLFNSFSGLDNAAAESHRKKALDTSIKRDEATYQLALVHRSQNQSELSIPLLVQIITSQSPGIGLGKKAYEQLLEIGFVDIPYTPPQPGERESAPPASEGANSEVVPQLTPNNLPVTPESEQAP